MRHNDPSTLGGVLDTGGVVLHPYCYVCNLSVLQDGTGFNQMFAEAEENVISPAKILADILEIEVTPELSHSQIVCANCNMLCIEYQQLIQRAETIRIEMTMAYNETVMKLTGLTEKDLKENEVAVVDNEEHLENALQNFNKELMSMEEVFQGMEGLVPETIGEGPLQSTVHIEDGIPKINFVWHSVDAETQHIDPSSLMHTTGDSLSEPHRDSATQAQEQFMLDPANCQTVFQSAEPIMVAESGTQDLCGDVKLDQFIGEPNDGIVEVTGEDGSPMYCIYEDVIESYSDAEEQIEMLANTATPTEDVIEYDEIIHESVSQETENEAEQILDTAPTTSPQEENNETEPEVAAPPVTEAVPNTEGERIQPLFIKIDNAYYCTLCSTNGLVDSYNVKTIALHLKKEHAVKILVCERCDAVFYRRPTYNEHMDQHTAQDCSDFCCDVCGVKFTNVRTLRVHRKTHASVNKMWPCDVCEKKFASKSMYEVHMNSHTGLRPFKCDVCPKDFTSKYILTVHMKTHKERKRLFPCDECGSSFFSRNNLVHHKKTHVGSRDYACAECGKSFLSQHNLNVHKVIHAATKPFACRTCGKSFARKAEIVDHERIHTGEKPFSCDLCDVSFAQRSNLYSHKRLTHLNDKRFKCEVCGASFKRRRLLLYHNRAAHTGERPYKCELCNATFVYPEHFQKHKRIHTGTKPFACEVCNKTFNSRDNRNAHRYVHSDKKPFECVTCGSGFMRKSQLYGHMQKRGHLNDTIVVNQPRITANDTLEYETESIANEPIISEQQHDESIIYEEENVDDLIDSEEYYVHSAEQQEEAEHLLEEASSSTSDMGLITKIEINDSNWTNFIEQD